MIPPQEIKPYKESKKMVEKYGNTPLAIPKETLLKMLCFVTRILLVPHYALEPLKDKKQK
jgi:hypothetical protein